MKKNQKFVCTNIFKNQDEESRKAIFNSMWIELIESFEDAQIYKNVQHK